MENKYKTIRNIISAKPAMEGAGVRINRVFGYYEKEMTDPFLMMDYFNTSNPDDYVKGFPWHPHRGIETITYMISGEVEHSDSLGNSGIIRAGDVQWMTAGSGIIHQEMPQKTADKFHGFQIWLNLPQINKMVDPVYRGIEKVSIPVINEENSTMKLISGNYKNISGPAKGLFVQANLMDIHLQADSEIKIGSTSDENILAFVFEGSGHFNTDFSELISENHLVILDNGKDFYCKSGSGGLRMIFLAGLPLKEPISWRGPIVMNTSEETQTAFFEYSNGTFIKQKNKFQSLN